MGLDIPSYLMGKATSSGESGGGGSEYKTFTQTTTLSETFQEFPRSIAENIYQNGGDITLDLTINNVTAKVPALVIMKKQVLAIIVHITDPPNGIVSSSLKLIRIWRGAMQTSATFTTNSSVFINATSSGWEKTNLSNATNYKDIPVTITAHYKEAT